MGPGDRWRVWTAYGLACLAIAAIVLAIVILSWSSPASVVLGHVVQDVAFLAFVLVGVVILRRLPRQPIGWICLGVGTGISLSLLSNLYADHALLHDPGSLPGGPWLVLLGNWVMQPVIVLVLVLLPLLFPTGRPPSPRWLWLQRAALWLLPVMVVTSPFGEDELRLWVQGAAEPVVLGANPFHELPGGPLLAPVASVAFIIAFLLMPFAVTALVQRYRRSTGVERQQLRWFRASLAVLAAMVAGLLLLAVLPWEVPDEAINPLFAVAVTTIPVTIGVAVLRYRLYDMDRIISRTVAYAVLSALLLGLYVAATLSLGGVARTVAGDGARGSDLVVALSTLLVAAAFGPLRRRVQTLVDRRFDRARYDGRRTVEVFGQRIRRHVDVATIRAETVAVTADTIRPSSVSLWLRPTGG